MENKKEIRMRARAIRLPARTVELLRAWYNQAPMNRPEDLIYSASSRPGDIMVRNTAAWTFRQGLTRAGIGAGKNLVIHSLRHTYNTRLRAVLPLE